MSDKTLVLGSGVSALAYLFYNPSSFALAGDQVGGLFANAKNLGPQYVWKTSSTTKLMRDLGLNWGTKTIRVGYAVQGEFLEKKKVSPDSMKAIRRMYSMKTRGVEPKESHMSDGKASFEIYDISVSELVKILIDRVSLRIYYHKATNVLAYDKEVRADDGRTWGYSTLVSTIPAPRLLDLMGCDEEKVKLVAWDKAYVVEKATGEFAKDFIASGFDYAYIAGEEMQAHRVKRVDESTVLWEYTMKPGGFAVAPGEGVVIQKGGQIIGGHEVLNSLPKSVELLGRYSEWSHGVRLEDVLEKIQ